MHPSSSPKMNSRNSGAAQVNVMWMIASCVILVFVAIFAYMSQQQAVQWESSYNAALTKTATAKILADKNFDTAVEISNVVGFVADDGSHSSVQAMRAGLENIQATFPDAVDVKTVEEAVPVIVREYLALNGTISALKSQLNQTKNDLNAKVSSHRSSISEKESVIRDLRKEMDDLNESLNGTIGDLESQRDGLREQVRDLDGQVAELRVRLDDQKRNSEEDMRIAQQRRDILRDELNSVARRTDTPDGTVLMANARIGRAWIDRGRLDRVRPGMQFAVQSSLDGSAKGQVRVLSIEDNRAECEILEMTDRFDPIASDDLILNAVYDPSRTPVAALLGNGFSKFSEGDMKVKLGEVGIATVSAVTNEVDILILGTPFFDEDTGEMVPWEAHESYKL
ncbi:MAG: hypothetical protein QGH51_08870, partial [Planctomycetota bacterium]|nr:hypothetical protein [Planctomycetota bacterium]